MYYEVIKLCIQVIKLSELISNNRCIINCTVRRTSSRPSAHISNRTHQRNVPLIFGTPLSLLVNNK